MPETYFGGYYGYADPTLGVSEAHEMYWGVNYRRLLKLKRKVDPRNLFENPQSVGSK
jgi:FAD/FMN-containing dehydrogenase